MASRVGGGEHVPDQLAKARCAASVSHNSSNSSHIHAGWRTGFCRFPAPAFDTVFMWFQWLRSPPPVIPRAGVTKGEAQQAMDGCTPYVMHSAHTGLRTCLRETFRDAQPSDVLVVRPGMSYLLYAFPQMARVACVGATSGCGTIDWQSELQQGLRDGLPLLRETFPGRIIWWLLMPLWNPDWLRPTHQCGPPLLHVGNFTSDANRIMRAELVALGAGDQLVDPTALRWPMEEESELPTYNDCIHLNDRSNMSHATVEQLASAIFVQDFVNFVPPPPPPIHLI